MDRIEQSDPVLLDTALSPGRSAVLSAEHGRAPLRARARDAQRLPGLRLAYALLAVAAAAGCKSTVNAPAGEAAPIADITPAQLVEKISASKAKLVILNVWATWCEPCREELPDFLKLARAYEDRGVELVLLS